ncbi:myo-inosose-2 dehydratase [Legionella longbeachae]|uniref:Putative myo-inositol catabolism protein iolE n=1 Tax=Legionella longbeachae serogroup 1 (strain NSW150) TaxID=661367 RepID=D3HJP1_LEGLN|nr:myo-inosose-2 dehydratase [Legionella longbeachae]VEE03169.1 myo-inositol catabolism protein iolE [Legionella oakridgensis]HBD7398971.1 myo-inosose-2 dehydratase [Legionella pneumophila]ARB93931.1 myo-inosose-2 dehydratase [Legionella longbeachae]ARM32931.1 myo-inosose-2 dehydratase [Legionella longbeachae]EEZ94250.1 inosose dehydratase [Legionella longbeachae D-4968]
MHIKLGIAPINWCNDDDPELGKEISFEQCIREMSEAGYRGTELGNKYPRDASVLKNALDNYGLHLSSSWFSTFFTESEQYDNTLSRFMEHLSFMKAMGASFINVCECGHAIQGTKSPILGSEKPRFNEKQWASLIQGLHAIGRIAYDFNMHLVYHYHAGTGVFYEQEIDFLMENTSPQLISLLMDTGHAVFAKINPVDLINKYGDRILYIHLKDIRINVLNKVEKEKLSFMDAVRDGVFTVPGDGSIDFATIFKALQNHQYTGWMIVEAEQDPAKAPPLEYAKKAYDYLQQYII